MAARSDCGTPPPPPPINPVVTAPLSLPKGYDQSAAIGSRITIPVRAIVKNPYDANSVGITTRKKSVTHKEKIVALRAAGASVRKIADQLGLAASSIQRILKSAVPQSSPAKNAA